MQGCEVQSPEVVGFKKLCSSLSGPPDPSTTFPVHLLPSPQVGGLNLLQRPLLSTATVGFTRIFFCLACTVKVTDAATAEKKKKKSLFSIATSNDMRRNVVRFENEQVLP